MKSTEETQGQHNSDDSSVKSSDKEIDFISPKKTIEEIKDEHKLNDSIVKSVADHEEIQSQLNVVTEAEPSSNGRDKLEQKENEKEGNEESFKTEDEFKTEIFKDDVNYEPLDTAKENEKQLKAEGSDSDNDTNSVKVNEKEEMVTVGRTFRTVKETPKDEVEYTDLYSKWKKENEDAAKKATTENSSVENDAEGANEGNQKKDLDIVTSEEEDADRRPNRDLDKIEY